MIKPPPSAFDHDALTWRKSSLSTQGNCPEFARSGPYVLLRDDADPSRPPTVWTTEEIACLFQSIKDGEFDHLTA
jgi:hypothetical protein